ncbi:uncharacterized protein M421DRAFT_64780 [Didymella exigua CBS 183.55]|uniref:Cell wall proline rich protein n=1 Tax=Didymella exigua CBS 183.55 TaxID=1150837 RepID=A0A6A5RQC5_9PLEO|nr:uncharacterized protein M421DRAFT_64780 [Didymella exigua CBS 183.55]KAF1927687.1 hypothetical protein M421DRAFT_64780 [Didymella exigua CBS 183.55]
MAQIALPRHQATQSQSASVGSPLYQRRQQSNVGNVEMVPNPDFSFPMRGPDTSSNDSSPTKPRPMSMQYPAARRGSMPHARQKSVNALPAFSFNPSGNVPAPQQTSPQTSPLISPTTPAKPMHGHRRGGSELIGGSARTGATLLSSSPTKDGSLSPPTSTLQPGPPAGRRGHAHRRSAAISSHDLSAIMTPPVPPVPLMPTFTGSAPSTPAENLNDFKFGHSVNKSMSQPCLRSNSPDDDSTSRPPSRARVGFSDKVEYIRPLSTISSETEVSTIRGHSNTNSLSSIVGGNTVSPPFTRSGTPTLPTVEDESRPGTAGAVLDKILSNPLIVESTERKRPMSAGRSRSAGPSPTSPEMPTKKRGFFRLESRNSDKSSHRRLPTSISDPALTTTFNSSPLVSPLDTEIAEDSKSKSKKLSHRPRKVKSWANSIIPRKSKHSKKSKRRAATPEQPDAVAEGEDTDSSDELELELDDFIPNFDDDTSVTIVSPTADAVPGPKINTDFASWQPRQLKRVDSDVMSPIIDMDAALGPFQTPDGADSRTQKRGFAAHRRAMHSASGFTPNHRRTESAPELVPFEFRPSAATSTSPMADVFEEEEPEEERPESRRASAPTSIAEEPEKDEEPRIQVVEIEDRHDGPAINWNFNDGLGLKARAEPRHSPIMEEPLSPHAVFQSSGAQVEVVEDYEEPRTSSLTHSSDSTVTPQSTLEEFKEHQSTMAVPAPLAQQSLMTPNTVTSSFGSPDYRSSQVSFDTPRVGTAASSVTDYPVLSSPRFGEPGPEIRDSSDVPSLTSSRSTMTSNLQGTFPLPAPRRPGDRSASLCSTPSEVEQRRRKRSSIASLSRLINGSYGSEKSKLSIEQRPQSAYLEPVARETKKKPRRLSKLKFWKSSKDSASSSSQAQ